MTLHPNWASTGLLEERSKKLVIRFILEGIEGHTYALHIMFV
jgi:hypothetical protein